VTLTFKDTSGVEVPEGDATAVSWVYTIEVPTAIEGPSVESIMVVAITTVSEFDFVYSKDLQLSDPPLSGSFYLMCSDTQGNTFATHDLPVSADANAVRHLLESDCPWLKGSIDVQKTSKIYASNKMGIEFQVHFHSVMGKLELFEMKSSIDDPLVGVEITFDQEVFRPYGESLIYPVIPAEYFYTYEEKPQVIVTIDEFPALCRHLDCDYEYTE